MCLYPRLIKNRKYTVNKKNKGIVPQVKDERVKLVPIGCGNCMECRKQKARGWQMRLLEEVKHSKNGKFVTMTFSTKSIIELKKDIKGLTGYELENQIATKGMRRFLERWRKKHKTSIKHWMITELGHTGTEHIHIHGIIWTNESTEEIEKIWKYGYMWKGNERNGKIENYVNAKTVNYIIKYVSKKDEKHKEYKSIILTSKGIGKQYTSTINSNVNKYKGKETNEAYRTDTGHKISMPIYWRNKIYSEEEREQLWLNRLDKQEMWIMGEKVDVSKGYEEYDELQKYYRRINTRMGYGNNDRNQERKEYENTRRNIIMKERIAKEWGKMKREEEEKYNKKGKEEKENSITWERI